MPPHAILLVNERAERHWRRRQAFESQRSMILDYDELTQELSTLRYKVVNCNGRMRMEKKKEAGRSEARAGTWPIR